MLHSINWVEDWWLPKLKEVMWQHKEEGESAILTFTHEYMATIEYVGSHQGPHHTILISKWQGL
jgi:hypothetical protein